jgi:hypothetical protein
VMSAGLLGQGPCADRGLYCRLPPDCLRQPCSQLMNQRYVGTESSALTLLGFMLALDPAAVGPHVLVHVLCHSKAISGPGFRATVLSVTEGNRVAMKPFTGLFDGPLRKA